MNFTHRDRLALRSALSKLSASASAMAEASREIDALVARMDTTDAPGATSPPVDAAPTPTPEVPSGVPGGPPADRIPQAAAPVPSPTRAAPAAQPVAKTASPTPVVQRVPTPYPRPREPMRPAKPPMTTEEKIMRGVAIGGATITIAGIILLVSVAIQRGWLGPLGRVLGAYLVGALLFGAAAWLRKRGTRVEGIIALMVTAQIAFAATTSALIFILEWWPPGLGSLVVLLGNAVFLLAAATWSGLGRTLGPAGDHKGGLSGDRARDKARAEARSVLLAVAIVTGLLTWMFAASFDAWWPITGIIVALLTSYTVADSRIRLSMAIMATILQFVLISSSAALMLPAACVGIITPVLLVALTLWDPVKPHEGDSSQIALAEYWRSFETNAVASWVGVVLPVPIVACLAVPLIRLEAVWFTLLPAVLIAAIGVFAVLADRPARVETALGQGGLYASTTPLEYQRIARLIAVMGLGLVATVLVGIRYNGPPMEPGQFLDGALPVVVYLLAGSALFVWLRQLPRAQNLGVVPWVAWLLGAVVITGVLFRHVIVLAPVWLTDTSALLQAVLILGFIAATTLARENFYHRPLWLQLLVGATMLYLSATAIVTITTYLGNLIAGTTGMHLGFLIGHATVSILWMALAAVLMLHRSLLTQPGALWTGVGLAVAGTVKLVFFDLVALSGVPRAIAFLLSGLALLAIASLRGRRTGDAQDDNHSDEPGDRPAPTVPAGASP